MLVIIKESPAITNVIHNNSREPSPQTQWKADLAASFSSVEALLDYLDLPQKLSLQNDEPVRRFPFRVTQAYASRINKGDPDDPLLLQILPTDAERFARFGYVADPVGDLQAVTAPGILHKYHGRVLLILTGSCAINCRYCFRREFPYAEGQLTRSRQAEALTYIAGDDSIAEVILSGGDPLIWDDHRLAMLVDAISEFPHVLRLRSHTRLPIVLPSRITSNLVRVIAGTRLKPVLVVHANHANEFDSEVGIAMRTLHDAGVTLLNQSVLLKGVNDSPEALARLSERLFDHGILPYYLHLLDKANGTGHFEVSEPAAIALYEELQRRLPGYLVPRLVREMAGEPYKMHLLKAKDLP